MRKLAALALFLAALASSAPPALPQARPRRASQTPPPAAQQQPAPKQTPAPKSSAPAPQREDDGIKAREVNEEVGEDDVVTVTTALVTIPVSVMDRDARFVGDIRKEEFRIIEDGVEQEVAYFASVEMPFTVALVLDTSGSTQFKLDDIQAAAIAFVEQLRPEDRVMVVAFDDSIEFLCEPTSDRRVMRDAIRRTNTGNGTRLYDAVERVVKERMEQVKGRKAIVLFSDGVDTTSKRASYQSTLEDVEELDALIYPIQYDTYLDQTGGGGGGWPGGGGRGRSTGSTVGDILGGILGIPSGRGRGPVGRPGPGPGASRAEYERAGRYLRDLAWKTGGRHFAANTMGNVDMAFRSIAEELRRQYSLGYYPAKQAQAAERRAIKVRVKRPNLVVRARDSYIYQPPGSATTAQRDPQARPAAKPELRRKQFASTPPAGGTRDE
ncbi:MAG TPA: VWA domain-containing protein [Pyrinomonadaceae bacterium]|nr:VWA domain-containing protein [Pyrinomonadaceae bacterium]